MPYIGAGIQRFNTADGLTVNGDAEVTGTVNPSGDTASGDAAAVGFTSTEGLILTGQGSTSDVVIKNDADTTVCFVPTGTDDLKFNDNAALVFGTGDDFKISHNGSKTKIEDTGTGNLEIRGTNIEFYSGDGGETLAKLTDDGAAELYHNNTKRIETTSTGVEVGDSSGGQVTFRYTGNSGFGAIKTDSNSALLFSAGATSFSEDMRIDSSGRTLVNATTSNTGSKFIVGGGTARTSSGSLTDEGIVLMPSANLSTGQYTPWLAFTPQIDTPSRARAGIGAVSTNAAAALDLVFATRSAADGSETTGADEQMRLTSGGDLLVGASSFSNSSNVKRVSPGTIDSARSSTSAVNHITFHNPNGEVGSIFTSSSSTSYQTSSDHRLKEAIVDMTGAIARVKQLAPKRFNFIADPDDTTVDGFLAHEAQVVVPEAVSGTHNEVDDDGNAVMQGIDQSKLVPLLTGALKEAIAKIETLETEMTALKARVTALEDA